jgi:hypothetical protein
MNDVIARYRAASETNDIDGVMATLAQEIELISPISGRMVFRGADDVRILLTAVYGTLRGWRWREELTDGERRVIVAGEGKVGPVRLGDVTVLELDANGQIARMRPYLRPWLGLTVFALLVGPKLARNPGVVLRALRG